VLVLENSRILVRDEHGPANEEVAGFLSGVTQRSPSKFTTRAMSSYAASASNDHSTEFLMAKPL
jgi:hypothetical protein